MSDAAPASNLKKHRFKILAAVVVIGALVGVFEWAPWKKGVFQGYVEGEYVYVATPVGGRLEQLEVHRGDTVQPGQLLFVLEPDPEKQQLSEAEARLQLADQNLKRFQALIETGSISAKELDEKISEQRTAAEAVSQLQWKLGQKTQMSRVEGYVQDTYFVKGEWVTEGRPVVSILPPGNVKIRFYVGAEERATLQRGQALRVSVFGGENVTAKISYLSSEAEFTPPVIYSNQTRDKLTFLVEAVPDPEAVSHLNPGQPVTIRLVNDSSESD